VHGGAHKLNNALGQGLLTVEMGKRRLIAETGAGQHGVATAMVGAVLGLETEVYMGEVDMARQRPNVERMRLLGARVIPVRDGSRTLKDAINAALRVWIENVRTTHYLLGSAVGPHPFPTIVADFQSVIGREIRHQSVRSMGRLPDLAVACVGGGSNAIGTFHPLRRTDVELLGIEAAGPRGHPVGAASLSRGAPGILHGSYSYVLQDPDGQVAATESVSAGLDYPGVGPEHAHLAQTGRAEYHTATDDEAVAAVELCARTEGILPALESAHAVAWVSHAARSGELPPGTSVLITMSGRGDKDAASLKELVRGRG